jgi:hypothetical protein
MVRVQQKARGRTTGTGGSSGLPCAMVLRLIRALPGDRACLPPSSADRSAHLAPALERQNHTTSPSAQTPLVRATTAPGDVRPSHPAPNVRDDREPPLFSGAGQANCKFDLGLARREMFLQEGLDRFSRAKVFLPVGQITLRLRHDHLRHRKLFVIASQCVTRPRATRGPLDDPCGTRIQDARIWNRHYGHTTPHSQRY